MIKNIKIFLVFVALLAMAGSCGPKPPPPPITCGYEEDAIQVYFEAGPRLNFYRERPHTCLVCMYQLENPNSFNQLKQDEKGLRKLLECSRFDGSVSNAKKLVFQPGQKEKVALARAEGTKYVGLVAGFYLLESKNVARLFEIPVIKKKKGLLRRKKIYRCGTLDVGLYLGSHSIQKMEKK